MRYPHLTFAGRSRAALICAAAGLLLIGTTVVGTALAAEQAPQAMSRHTHQLHGTVKTAPSAGATNFTLTTERFGDVVVSYTGSKPRGHEHVYVHARSFELSKLSDLKAGERVVVQGHPSADGKTFVALRVHVLPTKNATARASHLLGTISSVTTSAGVTTVNLKLADGTTQALTIASETKIRPEGKTAADLTTGAKITVISKNGLATAIVVLQG